MENLYEQIAKTIGKNYADRGFDNLKNYEKKINQLITQKKLLEDPLPDPIIQDFITKCAMMDSNNFSQKIGVGEREGRIACSLVSSRNFNLSHGIGRSGDLLALQPKAAGSSLLNQLTNSLLLDLLRRECGLRSMAACFCAPIATGMALMLCMRSVAMRRPPSAKYVLWSRIDQKSCLKCIIAAGFQPIVIDLKRGQQNDQLGTDLEGFERAILSLDSPDQIVCCLSTTSCFAPRIPDDIAGLARLCAKYRIPHIVNNAYGLGVGGRCVSLIEEAVQQSDTIRNGGATKRAGECEKKKEAPENEAEQEWGRNGVDLVVQSTDKNLLVPVGGSIVAGPHAHMVKGVAQTYPGRASLAPTLDVLLTLLSLGRSGYAELRERRQVCFVRLLERMSECAAEFGERILHTAPPRLSTKSGEKDNGGETKRGGQGGAAGNPVSIAMSLTNVWRNHLHSDWSKLTQIGSMLFTRGCSGARIVLPAVEPPMPNEFETSASNSVSENVSSALPLAQCNKKFQLPNGTELRGFDSHSNESCEPYLNVAAALGMREQEVDAFANLIRRVLHKIIASSASISSSSVVGNVGSDCSGDDNIVTSIHIGEKQKRNVDLFDDEDDDD